MKKISKSELKSIYNREIDFLEDGILNISNPYHFFCLTTTNGKNASSRTVVLRNLKKNNLSFYFNADYRSPKVKHLLSNDFCFALFYDNKRKMQLRASCRSIIHYKNKLSKKIWDKTPLQSRKCYMGKFNPSQDLKEWHPNIPKKYLKKDPDKKDSQSGYDNFTVINLKVNSIDILELHHDGHIRYRVESNGNYVFVAP